MATFIRICQWDEFQHYKDRDPPWIKLHRKLLTSETWVTLDDASRVLAVALMLLAAGTDNKIPANPEYLTRVAYLNSAPDWRPLVNVRFIDLIDENGKPLATASTPIATDTECSSEERQIRSDQRRSDTSAAAPPARKVSRETSTDPDWWLDFKLAYPNRAGDPNWRGAHKAANARISEGHDPRDFLDGAKRYARFCEGTGKLGTEFVQQASTFLGPRKPFLLPWIPPTEPENAMDEIMRRAGRLPATTPLYDSTVIEHDDPSRISN